MVSLAKLVLVILGLVGAACSRRVVRDAPPVPCELVSSTATEQDYPALVAAHGAPIVVSTSFAWACRCTRRDHGGDTQARNLGGDTQDRKLGGDTQDRNLGGDTQDRKLGGDTQARKLGGDTQDRNFGGDTQDRNLGGDMQDRNLGGDLQQRDHGGDTQARVLGGDTTRPSLACKVVPACSGFLATGMREVRYHDGTALRVAADGCIP